MKHNFFQKWTSLVLAVLMVITMVPVFTITASAAEPSVTIGFSGGSGKNVDTIPFSDETTGIAVVFAKNTHSTAPRWDSNCVRFYGTEKVSNSMTVSVPEGCTIKSITFTMNGTYGLSKVTPDSGTISGTKWTADSSNSTGSVVFTTTAQTRIEGVSVTYTTSSESGGDVCQHTNTKQVAEIPPTCTIPGKTAGVYCNDCKTYISGGTEIPATGVHTYVEGVCTGCGALDPDPANIVNKAYELAQGKTLAGGPYTLTGTITSIKDAYSSSSQKISVFIKVDGADDNKTILCYRLTDGSVSGVENLAVNDKITVKGTLKNYKGTIEFDSGCTLEAYEECQHTNTEAIGEAKEATCTENGITAGSKCSDCGRILEEQAIIEAPGHKDEDGDSQCDTCGATICTEHIWVDGDVKVAGDCFTDRVVAQVCQNCGEIGEDKVITAPGGHTEVIDAAVEATCTKTGLTEGSHCSACGAVIVAQTTTDVIPHEYKDGACTMCGKAEPVLPFKLGDVVIFTGSKADGTVTQELTGFESGAKFGTAAAYTGTPVGQFPLTVVAGYQNGTFAFKNGDNYITCYGDKNVKLSTTLDEKSSWTATLDAEGNLVLVACSSTETTKYYLQYNSGDPRFTTYSTGSQQPIKVVNYEPTVKSVALSLNEGVTVKVTIAIPAAWLSANEGTKVVFSNGKQIDAAAGESAYTVDLTPAQINDALTVRIVCGETVVLDAVDVSVAAYREKAIANGNAEDSALIKLIDAALAYADAADGTGADLANDFADVDDATVIHANDAKLFAGFSGTLGTYASVYVRVNTELIQESETLSITLGGTEIYNGSMAEKVDGGYIVIDKLYPANFDKVISIDAKPEGSCAKFTFNSYLKAVYEAATNQQVKNFAVATYLYGLAAEAYLATV